MVTANYNATDATKLCLVSIGYRHACGIDCVTGSQKEKKEKEKKRKELTVLFILPEPTKLTIR